MYVFPSLVSVNAQLLLRVGGVSVFDSDAQWCVMIETAAHGPKVAPIRAIIYDELWVVCPPIGGPIDYECSAETDRRVPAYVKVYRNGLLYAYCAFEYTSNGHEVRTWHAQRLLHDFAPTSFFVGPLGVLASGFNMLGAGRYLPTVTMSNRLDEQAMGVPLMPDTGDGFDYGDDGGGFWSANVGRWFWPPMYGVRTLELSAQFEVWHQQGEHPRTAPYSPHGYPFNIANVRTDVFGGLFVVRPPAEGALYGTPCGVLGDTTRNRVDDPGVNQSLPTGASGLLQDGDYLVFEIAVKGDSQEDTGPLTPGFVLDWGDWHDGVSSLSVTLSTDIFPEVDPQDCLKFPAVVPVH